MKKMRHTGANVDEIMKHIKQEVAGRRKGASPDMSEAGVPRLKAVDARKNNIFVLNAKKTGQTERETEYSIGDFLKLHDEEFVQFAYRSILRRAPEEQGLNYYLSSLRSGSLNKIEILGRLRYSPEGRKCKVKINGLLAPFLVNLAYKTPIAGYPFRLTSALMRLPCILRNAQEFEAFTHARFAQSFARLNNFSCDFENRI